MDFYFETGWERKKEKSEIEPANLYFRISIFKVFIHSLIY